MNVLLVVQQHKRTIFDRLQQGIADNVDRCDIHRLDDAAQWNLRKYFADHIDVSRYDRIVLMIRLKRLERQRRFLKTLPNLVFLEIDAWQDFHPKSKYRGKFSKHYRDIPWARIISTGYGVSRRLQAQGLDAVFAPKGYDQALMQNLHKPRSIELGFVGSLKSGFYSDRRDFLQRLAEQENLTLARTKPGRDYVEKLNDIRFFISADVGMGEYMIKNFEAMACGCVLFAYDQGEAENRALGLLDMENVVLYRDMNELREKLAALRNDRQLAERIAAAGELFAREHCTFAQWGARVAAALQPPLREKPIQQSFFNRLLLAFKR